MNSVQDIRNKLREYYGYIDEYGIIFQLVSQGDQLTEYGWHCQK